MDSGRQKIGNTASPRQVNCGRQLYLEQLTSCEETFEGYEIKKTFAEKLRLECKIPSKHLAACARNQNIIIIIGIDKKINAGQLQMAAENS